MNIRFIGSLLLAGGMLLMPAPSLAQIGISVNIAPPEMPVYEQPVCPGDGYLWTPGYWAWDNAYYWVPGTWVMAPEVGYLWTPGYWGWGDGGYLFNAGYWGTSIGFYGGINYGYGYFGNGYEGGRWNNGHFFYNTTVNNVNRGEIHNVYDTRVNVNVASRVSYNGGRGGIEAHATAQEEAAARERHIGPVAAQNQHAQVARNDPQQRASDNHAPRVTATARPNAAVHPKDLSPVERPAAPNTGNAKLDQKYQQQQNKLAAQQDKDRQQLQQRQDKEHQQSAAQAAHRTGAPQQTQQVEQRHTQQTQQMQQMHTQQTQQMQQRQGPPAGGGGRGGGRH
jgi:WXXGXW repeat (2 copies)